MPCLRWTSRYEVRQHDTSHHGDLSACQSLDPTKHPTTRISHRYHAHIYATLETSIARVDKIAPPRAISRRRRRSAPPIRRKRRQPQPQELPQASKPPRQPHRPGLATEQSPPPTRQHLLEAPPQSSTPGRSQPPGATRRSLAQLSPRRQPLARAEAPPRRSRRRVTLPNARLTGNPSRAASLARRRPTHRV